MSRDPHQVVDIVREHLLFEARAYLVVPSNTCGCLLDVQWPRRGRDDYADLADSDGHHDTDTFENGISPWVDEPYPVSWTERRLKPA